MVGDSSLLDNAVWHALTTAHATFAEGAGRSRRYPADVSVFGAVDGFDAESWIDLATVTGPAGHVTLFRDAIPPPPDGWSVTLDGRGHQMVLERLVPAPVPPLRRLTATDVPRALDLIARTRPGPFATRTIELGDYFGVFDGDDLVAMAGERFRLPGFTEISAVCTAPEARGRGLAAGLSTHVASGILARGDTPFLHHADDNHDARRVYERLGFVFRRPVVFRTLHPPALPTGVEVEESPTSESDE
ncbi:MAG TPA: GNAT family N-acetyltransferase [Acidimicrobiia bacterium]|nr:GNAT family N-acetyltransferase [Acidimicrobiia bacterium]